MGSGVAEPFPFASINHLSLLSKHIWDNVIHVLLKHSFQSAGPHTDLYYLSNVFSGRVRISVCVSVCVEYVAGGNMPRMVCCALLTKVSECPDQCGVLINEVSRSIGCPGHYGVLIWGVLINAVSWIQTCGTNKKLFPLHWEALTSSLWCHLTVSILRFTE